MPISTQKAAQPDAEAEALDPGQSGVEQQEEAGLTLDDYARAKALPVDFLKSLGVSQTTFGITPAVRIPYFGADGEELAVRFRIALEGDRFRWEAGTKLCLYGQERLAEAQPGWTRGAGRRGIGLPYPLVPWHSCAWLPGAANWREERDAGYLDGIETDLCRHRAGSRRRGRAPMAGAVKDTRSRETDPSADQRSICIVLGGSAAVSAAMEDRLSTGDSMDRSRRSKRMLKGDPKSLACSWSPATQIARFRHCGT